MSNSVPVTPLPTAPSWLSSITSTLSRRAATWIAMALVGHGLVQSGSSDAFVSSSTEFIAAALIELAGIGWSLYNNYLKVIAIAQLEQWKDHANEYMRKKGVAPPPQIVPLAPVASASPPPTASPAPPPLIALALALGALLLLGTAAVAQQPRAQTPAPAAQPRQSGPIEDFARRNDQNRPGGETQAPAKGSAIGDSKCKATGEAIADLHCVITAGGAKLILHLKQSYALASAPGAGGAGTVDNTSAMCTKALVPIVDLVVNGPKEGTLKDGDPMALTDAEKQLAENKNEPAGPIVTIEKIRILRLAIQSPALNDACGALVQDEVKNARDLVGKIVSLITGAGILAPIGL